MMMRVRRAGLEDAALLAELNSDIQQFHAEALPDVYKLVGDPGEIVQDFETRILADPDWCTWIVKLDHVPAGYACAHVVERPGHAYAYPKRFVLLDQISVRPAFQGQGCGRVLMDAVQDFAHAQQIDRIVLDVMAFNIGAIEFYSRLGFKMYRHVMDLNLQDERNAEAV